MNLGHDRVSVLGRARTLRDYRQAVRGVVSRFMAVSQEGGRNDSFQREQADIVHKVPVLGDIPVLGWAFKKPDKLDRDVELMVFLRPVITRSLEEAQALLEEVGHKSPRLLERAGLPREPDPGDALGASDR